MKTREDVLAYHLPPLDEEPLARLVRTIALVVAAALGLATLHNLVIGVVPPGAITSAGAAICALLGRRRLRLDSSSRVLALTGSMIAVVTALLLVSPDGVRDVAVLGYPAVLVVASLVVRQRAYVALAVVTIASAGGLALAEALGLRHASFARPTTMAYVFDVVLILTGVAVAVRLLAAYLLRSLSRAHRRAVLDELTGLPNRAALDARAASLLAEARDAGRRMAVIALDLEGLEGLNHNFGHAFGDATLRELGGDLAALVTRDCFAARYGGDKFIVALRHDAGEAAPRELAARLLEVAQAPRRPDGIEVRLDASCGLHLDDGGDLAAGHHVERAFVALGIAKARGGGALVEYTEEHGASVRARFRIERTLRAAVEAGVTMHYQPFFAHPTLKVAGLEALLRVRDADGAPVGALDVIQLAEASGQIHRLGWVIARAVCADIRGWRAAGAPPLPVSVNFSGLQIAQPGFVAELLACLREHDLPPEAVLLEVTETAATSSETPLTESLARLAAAGIRVAIDDFGAGYSSIGRLRGLAADVIKIDSSLVRSIERSDHAFEFLRKAVDLVNTTRAAVLFEGVENSAQAERITRFGGCWVQGYLFARPMPAEDVPAFMAAREIGGLPVRAAAR